VVAGWLWDEGAENLRVPSNSFGLHIGSVAPKIATSLHFGGFDQNRVIGPVSAQLGDIYGSVDLLDVQINVISGASPWSSPSIQGLLAKGSSSIGSAIPVYIDPLAVYLGLPKSTCDAIAAQLPVTFQAKYGLYF
jgi:hypothetical protein